MFTHRPARNDIIIMNAYTIHTEHLLPTSRKRLNLRPGYQRDRVWKHEQNCAFIQTIMEGGTVPQLVFYKLHSTNPDDAADYAEGYRYECVDGQNRLAALSAFITGAPIINDKAKEEFITTVTPSLHYHELSDVDRDNFDSFRLPITIIETPLTFDERKREFTRLQDGTRISRAEYNKNTDNHISRCVSRLGLRDLVKPAILGRMRAATSEWLNMITECICLYLRYSVDPSTATEVLGRRATAMRDFLQCKHTPSIGSQFFTRDIVPSEDDTVIRNLFDQLLSVLSTIPAIRCHKFQVTMLFWHILQGHPAPEPAVLCTWFRAQKEIDRLQKSPTPPTDNAIYMQIYEELQQLIRDPPTPDVKRARPGKRQRKACWSAYCDSREGRCGCCGTDIYEDKWEAGHIHPFSKGGSNELSNLIPICQACNRECGDTDLRDYARLNYPTKCHPTLA